MGLIVRGLTTDDDQEILRILEVLKQSAFGSNSIFMHESFWMNDVSRYTRHWFAWANSLFGELILTLAKTKPNLIFKSQIEVLL